MCPPTIPSEPSPRQTFNDNTQRYQNRNIVRRSRAKCLTSITNTAKYMGPTNESWVLGPGPGVSARLLWCHHPPSTAQRPLRRIQHGVGFCFCFGLDFPFAGCGGGFPLTRFVCDINEVYRINKSNPPWPLVQRLGCNISRTCWHAINMWPM